jgi:hypothetical protein
MELNNCVIRHVTGDELRELITDVPRSWRSVSADVALVAEFDEPKLVLPWDSEDDRPTSPRYERFATLVDDFLRAASCFRAGPISCPAIHVLSEYSFILPMEQVRVRADAGSEGPWPLQEAQYEQFRQCIDAVSGNMHPSLELATNRLRMAETRTDPIDKLLDAAIGLESILLHEVGVRNRGELRYRLSLRYAALARGNKLTAFKNARAVYDERCNAAHGSTADPALADAAAEMLREMIRVFLDEAASPRYTVPYYWEALVLNGSARTE